MVNKLAIIGIALALAGVTAFFSQRQNTTGVPADVTAMFNSWSQQQNKLYASPEEQRYRLNVFHSNVVKIRAHNDESYSVGINMFADLTEQEFIAKFTGLDASSIKSRRTAQKTVILGQTPTEVDWRSKGVVNAVKNQGGCGSCWAFSAISALESATKIAGFPLFSFSEQQLVDCATAEGNHGCNGGLMDLAFQYMQDAGGIETEAKYPYTAKDQKCVADKAKFEAVKVTGWTDVKKNDCNDLQTALAKQPVSVAIAANAIQFYTKGVFSSKFCGTGLNHGVTAVGYGHDATLNKDFWIVRNSWGGVWGEAGYIRMDRQVQVGPGICGICMVASYPKVSSP